MLKKARRRNTVWQIDFKKPLSANWSLCWTSSFHCDLPRLATFELEEHMGIERNYQELLGFCYCQMVPIQTKLWQSCCWKAVPGNVGHWYVTMWVIFQDSYSVTFWQTSIKKGIFTSCSYSHQQWHNFNSRDCISSLQRWYFPCFSILS